MITGFSFSGCYGIEKRYLFHLVFLISLSNCDRKLSDKPKKSIRKLQCLFVVTLKICPKKWTRDKIFFQSSPQKLQGFGNRPLTFAPTFERRADQVQNEKITAKSRLTRMHAWHSKTLDYSSRRKWDFDCFFWLFGTLFHSCVCVLRSLVGIGAPQQRKRTLERIPRNSAGPLFLLCFISKKYTFRELSLNTRIISTKLLARELPGTSDRSSFLVCRYLLVQRAYCMWPKMIVGFPRETLKENLVFNFKRSHWCEKRFEIRKENLNGGRDLHFGRKKDVIFCSRQFSRMKLMFISFPAYCAPTHRSKKGQDLISWNEPLAIYAY